MLDNSPEPSPSPQSQQLTGLSHEALLEHLTHSLDKLEGVCLPPPHLDHQHLLWFHPHEYEMVNSIWESEGLSVVMNRWGEDRTFSSGEEVDVFCKPNFSLRSVPEEAVILWVGNYTFDNSGESIRAARSRTATFALSDAQKDDLVDDLSTVGLLNRVIPIVDEATGAALRGAPILGVVCRAEWHASHNLPQGETEFVLSLTIAPPGREKEVISLTLDRGGNVFRVVLAESFMETGYEGHGHERFELTPVELRALLSLVNMAGSASTQSNNPFSSGSWLYHTLP